MSSAQDQQRTDILEWVACGMADVIKLVRDNKRSPLQLAPLKKALQSVNDNVYFRIQQMSLKELLTSTDPELLSVGWQMLYQKWGFSTQVPLFNFSGSLIEKELAAGRRPMYFAPNFYSPDMKCQIERAIFTKRVIGEVFSFRHLHSSGYDHGWMFVPSAPEPLCLSRNPAQLGQELGKLNGWRSHTLFTINHFLVFLGLHCEISADPIGKQVAWILNTRNDDTGGYLCVEYDLDRYEVLWHRRDLRGRMAGGHYFVKYVND